ncbi:MAG TPA: saccharopine dehydrogenase C-terminal domain-containing protein, partial [Thermoanaerobaculia bacterium]
STIVRDLARQPDLEVRVVDVSEENLAAVGSAARVERRRGDLATPSGVREAIAGCDAVVGAVPGRLGTAMLRTVIEERKPVADISFAPENPLELDGLARDRGVTAIVDCGVSPGLSNLAVGRAFAKLGMLDDAVIFVGGRPVERRWPYEYRIVFSATDVIEEYTRPARLVEGGRLVVKEALSEPEPVDIPGVGTLEAFNTDGLRTLLQTVRATNMKEKTLRYPGHAERMRMLRDTGFFADAAVRVGEVEIAPRALTETLLFRAWKRPAGEEELTVLRVVAVGEAGRRPVRYTFDLFDRTDTATGETSMARTTGFPCSIMVQMLARGEFRRPGILPPERFAGDDVVYEKLVAELGKRGVKFTERVE